MTASDPRATGAADEGAGEAADNLPPATFPEAVWRSARTQILERPDAWEGLAKDGHWLADPLWVEWAGTLEARGVTLDFLADVVAGYRSELWLWLMDERTWPHIETSLAGRTLRRAAVVGTAPEPAQAGPPS